MGAGTGGVLVQDRGPARMPAEVSLALRGPGWHAPFRPVPPSVGLAPVTQTEVDHEASAAASAFAAGAASVLSACSASAPARLKSGGIGARELARIGKAAQADDAVVRLTLETAYAAGLLARDGDRVASTEAFDAWTEREPPEQFAVLLQEWRNLPLTPTQARDEDNKALPALAAAPPCSGCLQARHGLLDAAADPGRAGRAGRFGSGAADRLVPPPRRLVAARTAVRHRDPRGRTPRRTRTRRPFRHRHPPADQRRGGAGRRVLAAAAPGHRDSPDRRRPHRRRHRHTFRAAGRTPRLRRGPGDQRHGVGVAVQRRQHPPGSRRRPYLRGHPGRPGRCRRWTAATDPVISDRRHRARPRASTHRPRLLRPPRRRARATWPKLPPTASWPSSDYGNWRRRC